MIIVFFVFESSFSLHVAQRTYISDGRRTSWNSVSYNHKRSKSERGKGGEHSIIIFAELISLLTPLQHHYWKILLLGFYVYGQTLRTFLPVCNLCRFSHTGLSLLDVFLCNVIYVFVQLQEMRCSLSFS